MILVITGNKVLNENLQKPKYHTVLDYQQKHYKLHKIVYLSMLLLTSLILDDVLLTKQPYLKQLMKSCKIECWIKNHRHIQKNSSSSAL